MADPLDLVPLGPWASTLVEGDPGESGPLEFGTRYEIVGVVSSGPMGEVRRCRDRPLARDVAMKVLPHGNARIARWRFLREARVQAQLRHAGVVPVHDIGLDGEERPFFTMSWIEGRSFREALAAGLARGAALDVLTQVCRAVAYAHARGVVHRDLKPSNVRVDEDGAAYLMDWGLAKLTSEEEEAEPITDASGAIETRAGSVLGTIGYMSPEQLRGEVERVDTSADVYGLGAMLFEVLTGAPLHPGKRAQRALSILRTDGASPAGRAPALTIPPALDEACVAATRLDPAAREISAAELAALLSAR